MLQFLPSNTGVAIFKRNGHKVPAMAEVSQTQAAIQVRWTGPFIALLRIYNEVEKEGEKEKCHNREKPTEFTRNGQSA